MDELTVLAPTRGRVANAERLAQAFAATCWRSGTRLVLLVDPDDPSLHDYAELQFRLPAGTVVHRLRRRMRLGPTLNAFSRWGVTSYAVGFMGDDHLPRTEGWDQQVITELQRLQHGFVYGDDLLQGQALPTACFMTSSVVDALGYMVPAGLIHLYIDNAWKTLGEGMDRLSYLPEVVIEHLHPAAKKSDWDGGYAEANAPQLYSEDERRYQTWCADGLAADIDKLRQLSATGSQ